MDFGRCGHNSIRNLQNCKMVFTEKIVETFENIHLGEYLLNGYFYAVTLVGK